MSQLVKTEAIVLKSLKYGDTSRIVNFYTLEFGKMAGLSKGARRGKKGLAGVFEPMSHVALVIYKKEKREIQLISQCDLISHFGGIRENLEKLIAGLSIVELTDILTHEGDRNPQFFSLIESGLSSLERADRNFNNFFWAFEIRLAGIMGFGPDFDSCMVCGKNITGQHLNTPEIEFRFDKGGALCRSCLKEPGRGIRLSLRVFQFLGLMASRKNFTGIQNIRIDGSSGIEIERFLWTYLSYHFGGLRKLKSRTFLRPASGLR